MANGFNLDEYLSEVEQEVNDGLLSREEFERIKQELIQQFQPSKGSNKKTESGLLFENRTLDDIMVKRLESQYHRTIFERDIPLEQENIETDPCLCEQELHNQVIIVKADGKECGAIWYHLIDDNSKDLCLEEFEGLEKLDEVLGSRFLYIEKLFVAKHKRKEKIGTRLIHELMKQYDESTPILVHSWVNAKNYYLNRGFIYFKDHLEDEGEQDFIPMVLPMNSDSFYSFLENHANRKHLVRCLKLLGKEEKQKPDLSDFNGQCLIPKYCELLAYASEEDYHNLNSNPFTILLYKTLGLEHKLLPQGKQTSLF